MIRRSSSKRRGRGRLALAWAMALASVVRTAHAEPPQRVSIRVPARADALLDEALVRVRGELGAMSLAAEVRPSSEGDREPASNEGGIGGTLIVERDGAWIRIRALGPASAVPVVQELDTRRADVTAEVVAVRAVEALRAVMSGLPERNGPLPKPALPAAKPPPTPVTQAAPSPSLAPRGESALSVWAGASGLYDVQAKRPALAAELGAFWGRSSLFGGALFSTTLLRANLHDAVGDAHVRRSTAQARLGVTLKLAPSSELWLMLGAGIARYGVEGTPSPGYIGLSGRHDSALLAAGVGGGAWFSPHFGSFLRLEASLATDAPAVRVTQREIAVLERPTLQVSLGLVIRAPRAWTP